MTKNLTTEKSGFHSEESLDESETAKLSEKKLRQQDSYWSWIVCAVGFTCSTIVLGCSYCFGIIFPLLLHEFKQGKSNTAWVGSLALSGIGLFGPVSGRLTDRFGARIIVICGSLLCAAGLLFTSLVPSLYLMFLTYGVIYGCGASFVYIALFEIVPRYFVKYRSMATGLLTMSVGGALVVMTPVCQVLLTAFGWRGTFAGLGCTVFIVFFLGWFLDPNVADKETDAAFDDRKESQDRQNRGMLDFSMWRNSAFVVLTVSGLIFYLGHYMPPIHLARYCEDLGIAEDTIVWFYPCIGLASLLARLPGSKLCDVFGPQIVLSLAIIVGAVSTVMLSLATNWIHIILYATSYGFADGFMAIAAILSCIQTLTPKQKAQGFGFYQFFICCAFLCGPPIAGLVADKTNSYHAAFIFAGGIEFLGLFVFVVCSCLKRRSLLREKMEIDTESYSLTNLLVVEKETVL